MMCQLHFDFSGMELTSREQKLRELEEEVKAKIKNQVPVSLPST